MDEMASGQTKPLRKSSNKIKDLMDTYLKNDNSKNIPITDSESENNLTNNDTIQSENINLGQEELDSKDFEKMIDDYKDAVDTLNTQLEVVTKEKDDLKDQLFRKAAELENIRRRGLKEKQEMIDYANERLLSQMIVLLDDINNAYNATQTVHDYDSLMKGVEMIRTKAVKLFEEAGIKQIESYVGKEFDVNFHEALMRMPSELPENFVVQEFQNGYMLNDKVLRHTKVITSSGM